MSEVIVAQQIDGDFRLDTRALAVRMANTHKSVMALIAKNAVQFEKFGLLPVETEEITGRGQPAKYALLNEDQCYLLLSFVRNSDTTIPMKTAVVEAFAKARKLAGRPAFDFSALQQLADLVPLAIEARVQVAEARMEAQIEQWQAEQPINSIQKGCIHRAVKELALLMGGKPRDFRRAWSALKDHYGLAGYGDLPSGKFDDSLRFIAKMAAAYENPRALEFVTA